MRRVVNTLVRHVACSSDRCSKQDFFQQMRRSIQARGVTLYSHYAFVYERAEQALGHSSTDLFSDVELLEYEELGKRAGSV